MARAPNPTTPATTVPVRVDEKELMVTVAPRTGARRLTLRVDTRTGAIRLTVPPGTPPTVARRFAQTNAAWLRARLEVSAARVPFTPGQTIPVLGEDLCIVFDAAAPRRPDRRDDCLVTGGDLQHVPRRIEEHLKATARTWLSQRARHHAHTIGRRVAGVSVRDTISRWGSCSSTGRLNFSWRLVLAPDWVADYVSAHEVAHLRHMNHSPAFWALCRDLAPQTDTARLWLRRHGQTLHRFGGIGSDGPS